MQLELCPICRTPRRDDASHCELCAYEFAAPEPKESPVVEPAAQVATSRDCVSSTQAPPSGPPAAGNATQGQKAKRRWPAVIGGLAVLGVLAGVGVVASGGLLAGNGSSPDGQGAAATGDGTLSDPGVWYGSATFDSAPSDDQEFDVAVGLQDGGGAVSGMVRFRSVATGRSASWRTKARVQGQSIVLKPGAWVSRQSGWSRSTLTLTSQADGAATGSADSDDGSGEVSLQRIADGPVTAESLATDWRVAYALDEQDAAAQLQDRRSAGLQVRDDLDYSWVPQVGSGCEGLPTSLGRLTSASILASHARLESEAGAVTLAWSDIGTETPEACPTQTMWIAIVPETFQSAAGAKRWCRENGFAGGSCAARYLVPQGSRGTRIEYL